MFAKEVIELESRFWISLTQKKYEIYFCDEHFRSCILIDRWFNIVVALISMGTLGIWLVSNNHPKIYASIIVLSEIARVIQPFLPYEKRIIELREVLNRLDFIYEDMENTYFSFSDEATDEEINNKYLIYERKWIDCKERYLKEDALSLVNDKINNKAKERRTAYFKNLKIGVERENGKGLSEES